MKKVIENGACILAMGLIERKLSMFEETVSKTEHNEKDDEL